MKTLPLLAFLALFVAAHGALAQPNPPHPGETRAQTMERKTGEIVSQPAKDIGLMKTEIPPILQAAADAPYSTKGLAACKSLGLEIARLNTALGPDFGSSPITENRAGALASAGGQAVVNSLIPFRGIVREVTGAGPAQRRLNAALDAGYARRGYLRGIYITRKCKPAI
jgi:hypothetical protein